MKPSRKALRPWLAGLLVVGLLLTPFTRVQHAAAADGSLVIAAIRVLQQQYVDAVQPVPLLDAAIATLRKATRLGADVLPDIPTVGDYLTGFEATAWSMSVFIRSRL